MMFVVSNQASFAPADQHVQSRAFLLVQMAVRWAKPPRVLASHYPNRGKRKQQPRSLEQKMRIIWTDQERRDPNST